MEPTDEQRQLWEAALADAGADDDVVLVVSAVEYKGAGMGSWYFGPGANLNVDPPVPLDARDRAELVATRERARVVVHADVEDELLLAGMRWSLELDRQRRYNRHLVSFGALLNVAYADVGQGPGSAVIYNNLPHIKDANWAAAKLVTDRFGPQTGKLRGPYGVLLRPDGVPSVETLPRRLVVAAAIVAEAFDSPFSNAISRDLQLRDLDSHAPSWWVWLAEDEDFLHLRKSLDAYVPSSADVDELLDLNGQAEAWRGWEAHFSKTLARGLDVLAQNP